MSPPPPFYEYDELYVVSDLHLGGLPGKQIFGPEQGKALAAWIATLAGRPEERRVALVLNGDIVDFLAEEKAPHFDPSHACAKLASIFGRYPELLDALRDFTKTSPNRHLVLVVGNHDIELAIPSVARFLVEHLSLPEAKGKIVTALDGKPFRCRVGGRLVHCVHGNNAGDPKTKLGDPWNYVDYALVARVGEAEIAGEPPGRLLPNGGTRLVIDAMNHVKEDHPFIDLLKPEDPLRLAGVILALDPKQRDKLTKFARPYATMLRQRALGTWGGRVLQRMGLLSEEPGPAASANEELSGGTICDETPDQLLAAADASFKQDCDPVTLVGGEGPEVLGALDWIRAVGAASNGGDPRESLRLALRDWMRGDVTFDIKVEDDVFEALDRPENAEVDFLVAGHTHLARALRRRHGLGVYYNSGTWIRLLRIDQRTVASPAAFGPLYEALSKPDLASLSPFDIEHRTVVAILADARGARGELRRIKADGTSTVVPDSELEPLEEAHA